MSEPKITYWTNGQKQSEAWPVNGKPHRIDGPAYRRWNEAGVLTREVWCIDGAYHRIDGPAWREWNKNGMLIKEDWYYNDVKYLKKDHPFNEFRLNNNLVENYSEWPEEMKVLFQVTHG